MPVHSTVIRARVGRWRRLVAAGVAFGVTLGVIVAEPTVVRADGGTLVRPAATIAWTACNPPGAHLQCADVQVPLDWRRPNGPKITLAVSRYLAADQATVIGPLFFNPGGPGVSGVDTLRRSGAGLEALVGGRFNIVSWDPRGTGASTSVRCTTGTGVPTRFFGSQMIPTTTAASKAYLAQATAFAHSCGAVSGPLLAHVSTADTARDLNDLRQLLGGKRLTYLGWSYGTFLGTTYANLFPRQVRAMVLDGAVDPTAYTSGAEAAYRSSLAEADVVFGDFESLCQHAGAPACPLAARGPVAAGVRSLLGRLRRSSIPAPGASPPGRLTYGDLLVTIFTDLGDPAMWPALAQGLSDAEGGDGSALLRPAQAFYAAAPSVLPPAIALGCANTGSREPPAAWRRVVGQLTRTSSLFGPLTAWWLWAPCASWPARSADSYVGPWGVRTKHPILVIGTTGDPRTPYTNAVRLTALLGHAVLLTHDGYGHVSTSDPSTCVEAATVRYLVDLVPPRRGTVCHSNRQPFDAHFGDPLPQPQPLDP